MAEGWAGCCGSQHPGVPCFFDRPPAAASPSVRTLPGTHRWALMLCLVNDHTTACGCHARHHSTSMRTRNKASYMATTSMSTERRARVEGKAASRDIEGASHREGSGRPRKPTGVLATSRASERGGGALPMRGASPQGAMTPY